MAENKASTDVLSAAADGVAATQTNGESLNAKSQRAQSSPSSIVEDSGTESGEDLRLLNPELLAEVRGALSKLESALPTLDTVRRASIIPLVTKLQSCLKVSEGQGSGQHLSSNSLNVPASKRSSGGKHQQRKDRHTVGVSEEELADARKWLEENFTADEDGHDSRPSSPTTSTSTSMKYESSSKAYKPVKFTPTPREHRHSFDMCKYDLIREPPVDSEPRDLVVDDSPKPLFAFRTYIDPLFHSKQLSDERSSDEGDVSSTEEEFVGTVETKLTPEHHNNHHHVKRIPARFQKNNNKKVRMKRANTIDIPKLINCEQVTSSGDEAMYKSADELQFLAKCSALAAGGAGDGNGDLNGSRTNTLERKTRLPPLEVRTENDLKFAKFLEKTQGGDPHSKTVTYNPNAGGAQWSNRFSYIKTAFEQGLPEPEPDPNSSAVFKPIRKTASFPRKVTGPSSAGNGFKHALKSPFKPVTKAVTNIYNSLKPNNNEYNNRNNNHKPSLNTPKTYYTPTTFAPAHKKQNNQHHPDYRTYQHSHHHHNNNNGYHSDGKGNYYVADPSSIPRVHYYVQKPAAVHYRNATNQKPDYFLSEPSAYLHVPNTTIKSGGSQPVSPTGPTSAYLEFNNPYMSLPPSPQAIRAAYGGKPTTEFYEEQPAHSKIMGKPQQAVVVNNVTNYRHPGGAPPPLPAKPNFMRDFVAANLTSKQPEPAPKNMSTYQKLAEKSPALQNFAQNSRSPVKCEVSKPCPPPTTLPKVNNDSRTYVPPPPPPQQQQQPPLPKKQVKIVEDDEAVTEPFYVLNQRNKFETLKGGSGSQQQHLPPQINEKAFFKPVSSGQRRNSGERSPQIVVQERSPPQSPVQMPSVLQKSESWHQMIMERMKQAKPPAASAQKPKIARAKSTHNLATLPKQYEAILSPETLNVKKQTVEQFLMRDKRRQTSKSPPPTKAAAPAPATTTTSVAKVSKLNEDFKNVDEAFESLFNEASTC